jgi:hypothetical protein
MQESVVTNRSGAKWEFSSVDYLGDITGTYIIPVLWTSDGRFLYFSIRHVIEGPAKWVEDEIPVLALLRMDLVSGAVDAILPGNMETWPYYWFSISPTGNIMVYIQHPPEMHILDLNTEIEYVVTFDKQYSCFSQTSSISCKVFWSEDGTEIFFYLIGVDGLYLATISVHNHSTPIMSDVTPFPTLTPTP